MNYFIVDRAPTVEKSFCMLEGGPRSIAQVRYRLIRGKPMGSDYPQGVTWRMSDRYGGIRLPSLIGNTGNMLVVDRALMEVFARVEVPMERLPFALVNHKDRVASQDYFIINPLGTFDCLLKRDGQLAQAHSGGGLLGGYKYVLDSRKLKSAPEVFRVLETPEEIVISHRLADALKTLNPTNVYLFELDQASSPVTEEPEEGTVGS
ncbi:imm11 family protein [Myxococcus qinghaiensis]|uniref:imm11 family protein n=1 Tax=Myxococcus qinghaiensis TaxID=2906758 RepID=UPI0020A7C155|nr:hypothetical protein [Myxococcus qinghaiensis]MCP3163423.1 hypothetical protein [Myxococcus qinghaiensis]